MRATVFIVLGIALLTISIFAKNSLTEKWSSFAFGFSLPMFAGGIIAVVKYIRLPKQAAQAN